MDKALSSYFFEAKMIMNRKSTWFNSKGERNMPKVYTESQKKQWVHEYQSGRSDVYKRQQLGGGILLADPHPVRLLGHGVH